MKNKENIEERLNTDRYRVDFTLEEIVYVQHLLGKALKEDEKNEELQEIVNKVNSARVIKHSEKKAKATTNASKTKIAEAKAKIETGINILRMEGKKFTHYSISKASGVSFQTVKKYVEKETLEKLNKPNCA